MDITPVASDDPTMLSAINEARRSFELFLEAFFNPKPNQNRFLVKIGFEEGAEHIWLADLDLSANPPTGVVANEPKIKSVDYMQRVPIDFLYLSDWMYYEDDVLVGGFTTKVLSHAGRSN
jgi:uncharacterized protein YegJ (DUF2314 family)